MAANHPDEATLRQGINAAIDAGAKTGLISRLSAKYFGSVRKAAKR